MPLWKYLGIPPVNETDGHDRLRQSSRVNMRVPVEVRCKAPDGSLIEESAQTGVVGVYGAMVRMSRSLPIGTEVELTNHFSQQTATFRVAWAKDGDGSGTWEIGVESLAPLGDFWGVRFPPRPPTR